MASTSRKSAAVTPNAAKARTAKPRERAKQQRSIETRRKILDAAIEQFAENGYDGASTRSVAEAAGLPHTLVTYHFGNKEGLWLESIKSLSNRQSEEFQERVYGLRGVDDATTLRLIYEEFIRFSAAHPQFHRIMGDAARNKSPQLSRLVKDSIGPVFQQRAEMIRSAQKAGRFVAGDPIYLQYLFIGAATRIFMLAGEVEEISGRNPYDPDYIEEHVKGCISLFFRD